MRLFSILLIGLLSCLPSLALPTDYRMDISGLWRFQLDPMGFGKTAGSELYLSKLTETIHLPGSTDEGGKGVRNVVAHVDRLSRKFEYCGQAWYQREVVIPEEWRGREIILSLERCHWETAVYVDDKAVGTDERLSTPNRFVLTSQLTPGIHTLTICVDNRLKYPMDQWDHGTTEYTQTNWNGIVGSMELVAKPASNIAAMDIYPDVKGSKVRVRFVLNSNGKAAQSGKLELHVKERNGRKVCGATIPVSITGKADTLVHEISLGKNVKLWDEFSPNLYQLSATLSTEAGDDAVSSTFGMRLVEQGKHHVRLNGRDIHLRGALDCCVFPLTGYPATDVAAWKRIMSTVKEYGLNHIRFHSWCPPEAAFEAAD